MQVRPNLTTKSTNSHANMFKQPLLNNVFLNQIPPLDVTNIAEEQKTALFKTEFCRNWLHGRKCQFGENCLYAHGESERHYKGNIVHNYKNRLCEAYHSTFLCIYGSKCNYRHENYERKYFYFNFENIELKCRFITNKIIMDVQKMLEKGCSPLEIIKYIYEEGLSVHRLSLFKKMNGKHIESLKDLMEDCYELYQRYDSLAEAIDEYNQTGSFGCVSCILSEVIRDFFKLPNEPINNEIEKLFSKHGEIFLGL